MLSSNLSDPVAGRAVGGSPVRGKTEVAEYQHSVPWMHGLQPVFRTQNSTASTAPFSSLLSGVQSNIRLVQILRDNPGTLNAGIICAYLNARLSENTGGSFKYILTSAQVVGLVNGSIPLPPAYVSLHSFLSIQRGKKRTVGRQRGSVSWSAGQIKIVTDSFCRLRLWLALLVHPFCAFGFGMSTVSYMIRPPRPRT